MFASADALTLPPLIEPPIRMTSFTSGTIEGSFSTASAMLVSGPTGTKVISWGAAWIIWMMRSGPKCESTLHLLAGNSMFGQTILSMPKFGGNQFLKQRMLGAGRDWNVASIGERNHSQRIFQTLTGGDIPRHHGDCADIQFRRIERQHQCQSVVRSGIGVER